MGAAFKSIISLISLICVSLLLAGCMDITTTYDIKSKDKVIYKMNLAIDKNAMETFAQAEPEMKNTLCANGGNDVIQMATSQKGNNVICTMTMNTQFAMVERIINQNNQQEGFEQKLEDLGDNKYRFSFNIEFSDNQKKLFESQKEENAELIKSFKGRKMTIEFIVPKIIKTSGQKSADNKSVKMIVDLDDINAPDAKPIKHFVEFSL